MLLGIDHIEMVVPDIDIVAEFFKKLGFEEVRRTEHHGSAVEMRLPGENQTLWEFHTGKSIEVPGINHIAFRVDNIEATVAELQARGIRFDGSIKRAAGSGRVTANLRDPNYHRLQLTE
jgi:glyoxylase I family protein